MASDGRIRAAQFLLPGHPVEDTLLLEGTKRFQGGGAHPYGPETEPMV